MPIPAKPVASGAPSLAPAQGDHVFGDAIGMVNGALGELFGGLQGWEAHMQNYNPLLRASWTTMSNMDLGHILGPNQPLVRRGGRPSLTNMRICLEDMQTDSVGSLLNCRTTDSLESTSWANGGAMLPGGERFFRRSTM